MDRCNWFSEQWLAYEKARQEDLYLEDRAAIKDGVKCAALECVR